jgi:hypothetical protein
MGRTFSFFFVLCAFTLCATAQTTNTTITQGAYPTVGQPMSGALPLPAPPEMALPGSGTPVGVPPNVDVNNARTGGAGAVVQPGVSDLTIGGQPLYVEPRIGSVPLGVSLGPTEEGATVGTEPTGYAGGEQQRNVPPVFARRMANGNSNASGQPMSLGELAAQLRGRKPLPKRTFDNNDIVALNERAPSGLRSQSEDLPQSDQPTTTAPKKAPEPKQVPQKNQTGVLDPNDLRKVEDALQRSQQTSQSDQVTLNNPK